MCRSAAEWTARSGADDSTIHELENVMFNFKIVYRQKTLKGTNKCPCHCPFRKSNSFELYRMPGLKTIRCGDEYSRFRYPITHC